MGFVVGKLCPLHKGHEFLINSAIAACDQVFILSYSSQRFTHCSIENRNKWLKALFPHCIIRVEANCPEDDAPAFVHRAFCATIMEETVGSVDAIFTSEEYGFGFAEYCSLRFNKPVDHQLVDLLRIQVPVSGTKMRNNFDPSFCSPIVARDFTKKIAILGGESSGKSTLSRALGQALNCPVVDEYGRTYCDNIGGVDKLQFDDMLKIGETHIENEDKLLGSRYLVCDTTPLVTRWYSEQLFQSVDPRLMQLSLRPYDYYFLLSNDFPFVQDGTRQDDTFRQLGYQYFANNLPWFHVLSGSVEQRVNEVLHFIS